MYKKFVVYVDGFNCGIVELTPADIAALACDPDIIIKEV